MVGDSQSKRRLKHSFRRRHKNAKSLTKQADKQIEHLLIRRFDRLISVRRFIFLWVSLFVLMIMVGTLQLRSLSSHYQTLQPTPGGLYHEGIVGTFTNANPLFASGTANTSVNRLVFSGLFKYDNSNNLVGDLATNWTMNEAQTQYLIYLKKGIKWHDGVQFKADDVLFTYHSIQDIETQSTLYSSWKDIKVTKKSDYVVAFDLPNALSAFPYALTNGIVPKHLLKDIPATQLRSASFNTSPVGTGPFEWRFVDVVNGGTPEREQRISLAAYDNYWGGRPKLDGFNLITYADEDHLITAFKKEQLNAMSGLETLPPDLVKDGSVEQNTTPLTGIVMAFFNNSKPLLNDVNIRKALAVGVDRKKVAVLFDHPVKLANGPLLSTQLGYDASVVQPPYNLDEANSLLDRAGWKRGEDGQRVKDGKALAFNLSAQENQQSAKVARFLQGQWKQLGVKITVNYSSPDDLQSRIIANHDYEILLHGISLGVDPDVFAYWDSSQASLGSQGRLNLSEYKSAVADQAIESARTRADKAARVTKYKAFLQAWVKDAPALALYQPNFLYVTRGEVYYSDRKASNSSTDRFYNVSQWMIRQQKEKNTLL